MQPRHPGGADQARPRPGADPNAAGPNGRGDNRRGVSRAPEAAPQHLHLHQVRVPALQLRPMQLKLGPCSVPLRNPVPPRLV